MSFKASSRPRPVGHAVAFAASPAGDRRACRRDRAEERRSSRRWRLPRSRSCAKLQLPADTPAETAYIKAVLADKPMGYWPLNEPAGCAKFLDRSGNGIHGYAMNKVDGGATRSAARQFPRRGSRRRRVYRLRPPRRVRA